MGAEYDRRMGVILRWRRIGNVFCVFVALYAISVCIRDPGLSQPRDGWLVGSLMAFVAAGLVALNLLTLLLRK